LPGLVRLHTCLPAGREVTEEKLEDMAEYKCSLEV
jgi:hypothetical protein